MLEYWFSNFCPCWNHLEGLLKCQSLSSRVRQEHLQFSWLIMWCLCCWSRDHILRTTALKHQSGHAGEGRLVEIQNLEPHLRSAESDIFVMMLSMYLRTWMGCLSIYFPFIQGYLVLWEYFKVFLTWVFQVLCICRYSSLLLFYMVSFFHFISKRWLFEYMKKLFMYISFILLYFSFIVLSFVELFRIRKPPFFKL